VSVFDNLPLAPKQIRSIADSERSYLSIWSGAVRSGKTVASIIAFLIAVAKAPTEGEIAIFGKTRETIERNILGPMMTASLVGIFARQVHHVPGSNVAIILGRRVSLIGANDVRAEEKVRGMTLCLAMLDEATLVPEAFWNMVMSRLSVPGARMLATTNPDARSHWLRKEWILKAHEKGIAHWHFTLDDNPFLTPEFVMRTKANYAGLWYKRFVLGEWVQAEGSIYDMWDEDRHVVDELPPMTFIPAIGVDYGTANVFAALALGLGVDGRLYATSEYRYEAKVVGRQLTDAQYVAKLKLWRDQERIDPQFVVVDPSASSFITELLFDGWTPTKGDNAVLDGIRLISSLISTDRFRVHRSCAGLIDEFPGYVWDDKAQLEKGEDKPVKLDDHSLDGVRYAIKTTEFLWSSKLRPLTLAA
jgi:PBSX family phage terminase large subunit